jgi:hypothetical protein
MEYELRLSSSPNVWRAMLTFEHNEGAFDD